MSTNPFDEEEARRKALMDELFPEVTADELREQQADDVKRGEEFFSEKRRIMEQLAKGNWPLSDDSETVRSHVGEPFRLDGRLRDPNPKIDRLLKEIFEKAQRGEDPMEKPTPKPSPYAEMLQQEREREDQRYVRVGGWQAGKDGQDHEALRFEIEAERALFLGKPVPTDKELATKHLALAELHKRYQLSGDPSLLIGIADLSAEYNRMLADYAKGRPMVPKPPVIE